MSYKGSTINHLGGVVWVWCKTKKKIRSEGRRKKKKKITFGQFNSTPNMFQVRFQGRSESAKAESQMSMLNV